MSEKTEIESARFCILMCWIAGIVGGLIVAVLVVKSWDMHALAGLFLGFLATLALAFLFYWLFCDEKKDAAARKANAWVEPDELPEAAEIAEETIAETAPEVAEAEEAVPVSEAAPEASEPAAEPVSAQDAPQADPDTKPLIQPSKPLAGETDLDARKGEWRYGEADKPETPAAPSEDFDKDGIAEGSDEGARPEALDGPRDGKADNLKEIKGVGPKMETMLNDMGFYHFSQIAVWTGDEIAWVDANLKGFKGRVTRDDWVKQAKVLATGAETEFSKRVEDGDVY